MTDTNPDETPTEGLTDEQLAALEDDVASNLTGIKAVAEDTQDYFLARAMEEDLTGDELLTAVNAISGSVADEYAAALPDDVERPGPEALLSETFGASEETPDEPEPKPRQVPGGVPETPVPDKEETLSPADKWKAQDSPEPPDRDGEASTDGGAVHGGVHTNAHDAQNAQTTSLFDQVTQPASAYAAAVGGALVYFTSTYAPVDAPVGLYLAAALAALALGAVMYEGMDLGESA